MPERAAGLSQRLGSWQRPAGQPAGTGVRRAVAAAAAGSGTARHGLTWRGQRRPRNHSRVRAGALCRRHRARRLRPPDQLVLGRRQGAALPVGHGAEAAVVAGRRRGPGWGRAAVGVVPPAALGGCRGGPRRCAFCAAGPVGVGSDGRRGDPHHRQPGRGPARLAPRRQTPQAQLLAAGHAAGGGAVAGATCAAAAEVQRRGDCDKGAPRPGVGRAGRARRAGVHARVLRRRGVRRAPGLRQPCSHAARNSPRRLRPAAATSCRPSCARPPSAARRT